VQCGERGVDLALVGVGEQEARAFRDGYGGWSGLADLAGHRCLEAASSSANDLRHRQVGERDLVEWHPHPQGRRVELLLTPRPSSS
jgi:hypothetical protein